MPGQAFNHYTISDAKVQWLNANRKLTGDYVKKQIDIFPYFVGYSTKPTKYGKMAIYQTALVSSKRACTVLGAVVVGICTHVIKPTTYTQRVQSLVAC